VAKPAQMLFMIVGKSEPLYEAKLGTSENQEFEYLQHFIMHSSMDMVQSTLNVTNGTYLKVVDRFNSAQVSAYITPGGATMLLLHYGKTEEAVRRFFIEVHEMYTKHIMNPLYVIDSPIQNPYFDSLVAQSAKRL
jgi:trafficking protein particle complex subunit 2